MFRQGVSKLKLVLQKPAIGCALRSAQHVTTLEALRPISWAHGLNHPCLGLRSFATAPLQQHAHGEQQPIPMTIQPYHRKAAKVVQHALDNKWFLQAKLAARDLMQALRAEQEERDPLAAATAFKSALASANQHVKSHKEVPVATDVDTAVWIPPELSSLLVKAFVRKNSVEDLVPFLQSAVSYQGDYSEALGIILSKYYPLLLGQPDNEQYSLITFQALKALENQCIQLPKPEHTMDILALFAYDDQIGGACWQEFTQMFDKMCAKKPKTDAMEVFERYVTLLVKQSTLTGFQLVERLLPLAEQHQLVKTRGDFFMLLLEEYGRHGSIMSKQKDAENTPKLTTEKRVELQQKRQERADALATRVIELVNAMHILEIPFGKPQLAKFISLFRFTSQPNRLWAVEIFEQLQQAQQEDPSNGDAFISSRVRDLLECCLGTGKWELAQQLVEDWKRTSDEPVAPHWLHLLTRILIENHQVDKAYDLLMERYASSKGANDAELCHVVLAHYATSNEWQRYDQLLQALSAHPECRYTDFPPLIRFLAEANLLERALQAWKEMEQKMTLRKMRRVSSSSGWIPTELFELLNCMETAADSDSLMRLKVMRVREMFHARCRVAHSSKDRKDRASRRY